MQCNMPLYCCCTTANESEEVVGQQHKVSWCRMETSSRGGFKLSTFDKTVQSIGKCTGKTKVGEK